MREALRDPQVVYERRWLTLLVLCISLMVIGLDNTILNVALPTLAKSPVEGGVGASASQLQWIVDSYTIVFAGLLLTAGSLGDRFGRYRFLAFGLTVFGLGSAASALATDAGVLIATRAVMGIGGAFIMPSTLSILTNVFTDPRERTKAIGIWAGVSAIGIGVGPVIGGFLLVHFWWGSVFLVNVPVVLLGLTLGYMLVPESSDPSTPRLDPVGAALSIAGLGTVLWAVIEAPANGWTDGRILAAFAVGAAILAGFLAWELHSSHPMLDLRFFENPRFSAASGAITLTFLALFGVVFLLTQYLQSVLGYSTIKAGAVLLPMSAVLMVAAPLSSVWTNRFGNKVVVAAGLAVVAAAMVAFTTFQVDSSMGRVIACTMLLALGMGNIMAPATDSIMGSLPRQKAGVGSAVNDTTRQVGGAVGVAVMGSLLSSIYGSRMGDRLADLGIPGGFREVLSDSIGKTLAVLDTDQARPIADQVGPIAKQSFVNGMHVASLAAAAVLLVGMVCVIVWLPARARDEDLTPEGASFSTPRRGRAGAVEAATTESAAPAATESAAPAATAPAATAPMATERTTATPTAGTPTAGTPTASTPTAGTPTATDAATGGRTPPGEPEAEGELVD